MLSQQPCTATRSLQRCEPPQHSGRVHVERDFAAWLDRRDPDALARVFDATGGKLLLVALHLGSSGATAEDLVQATLLAAMARGKTWDRERPLWPWLAAILHNEAAMELRRRRRRREVALDEAGEAKGRDGEPPRLVQAQEALDAVLAAIATMPLPYRQVLRLRLVHGLAPAEIARALEVPAGTVRARLHRGLEQLRGALPAGIAGVVAAVVGDGTLLAQARARVLAEAAAQSAVRAGAGATGAGVAIGGGLMTTNGKTIGVLAAACGLLLVLGA